MARSSPTSSTMSPTATSMSAPPAPKSGSRPTARSTASSARSAPAARWPGSRWRLRERNPDVAIALADVPGRGALQLLHDRRTEGRGQLDHRRHRPGPDHRQPRRLQPDHSLLHPRRGEPATSPSPCSRTKGSRSACRRASMSPARSAWRASLAPARPSSPCCATPATRYQSRLFNPEFLRSKGLPARWLERPADIEPDFDPCPRRV